MVRKLLVACLTVGVVVGAASAQPRPQAPQPRAPQVIGRCTAGGGVTGDFKYNPETKGFHFVNNSGCGVEYVPAGSPPSTRNRSFAAPKASFVVKGGTQMRFVDPVKTDTPTPTININVKSD